MTETLVAIRQVRQLDSQLSHSTAVTERAIADVAEALAAAAPGIPPCFEVAASTD